MANRRAMADQSGGTASVSRVSEAPLVGRSREIERLRSALTAAAGQTTRLILVAGEAGMGKTALARSAEEIAASSGARVVTARCWEGVDTPALWLWNQVLRQLGSPMPDGSEDDRFSLFDEIASVVKEAASDSVLLLVFEDVHAADETSLLMLQFLSQFEPTLPMLIVTTYDPHELRARGAVRRVVEQLSRDAETLELKPLEVEDVADLYRQLTESEAPDATALGLTRVSQGNPFFAREAIRLLTTKGDLHRPDQSAGFRVPEGARGILRQRLSALPDETLEILAVAAVIGPEFDASLLATVAELEPDQVLEMLDVALRAGIIEESSAVGTYTFDHILLRESLYEDLTAARRMRLHRAVAETIELLFGSDGEDQLPLLAHHWFKAAQAGDADKAIAYTRTAAERAVAQRAYEEALRLFQRAIKLSETTKVDRDTRRELKGALEEIRQFLPGSMSRAAGSPERASLSREGDFWVLTFEGKVIRVKDSKGMGYLARLLANPGAEIHAIDLAGPGSTRGGKRSSEDGLTTDPFGAADVLLDETAKARYRARIEDLRSDIEEAESFNDTSRAELARVELDALVQELSRAVGLGGRDRSGTSPSERARVNVTKVIRDVMQKIAQSHAGLGDHLNRSVRTGTFCSYDVDPRFPIKWDVRSS